MAGKRELAEKLASDLDAVSVNAQAVSLAKSWLDLGRSSAAKFGGFQGGMVQDVVLSPDIDALAAKLRGFPNDSEPVNSELWYGGAGLRRAIQNVASGVWAQEAAYPEGTSIVGDAEDFGAGAAEAVGDVIEGAGETVKKATDVLGPLLWPLAIAAVAVVAVVVIVKVRAA